MQKETAESPKVKTREMRGTGTINYNCVGIIWDEDTSFSEAKREGGGNRQFSFFEPGTRVEIIVRSIEENATV